MTNYLDFLKTLLAFGNEKLPQVLTILQAIVDQVTQLAALLGYKAPVTHNAPEITPEVLECEGLITAQLPPFHAAGQHGAIGDGTLLRNLFAFVTAHPELLQLLLSLIKK